MVAPSVESRIPSLASVLAPSFQFFDLLDDHGLQWHVLVERSAGASGAEADLVHDHHAFDDLAEDRVTPAARLRIQCWVIAQIYIELGIGAVWIAGASDADSATPIRQPVARFIGDAGLRGLFDIFLIVAAALCNEIGDDAVEY